MRAGRVGRIEGREGLPRLLQNSGARLCRPRPAAAGKSFQRLSDWRGMLRLVCDTAALRYFRQALNVPRPLDFPQMVLRQPLPTVGEAGGFTRRLLRACLKSGGRHLCLPWSRCFQPGGRNASQCQGACKFSTSLRCPAPDPGGRDAALQVSQRWPTLHFQTGSPWLELANPIALQFNSKVDIFNALRGRLGEPAPPFECLQRN